MSWFDAPRTVGGVSLRGGFLMESGPFGHSGASIAACTRAGFSAVSTETISLADGTSPWWNIYRQGENLYNCSKWSDIPLARWVEREIPQARARGATLVATVGHTVRDVEAIAPVLADSGVDAIKACTYHAHEIVGMVAAARRLTKLPVWAKISANWPNFLELALACREAGADALVAIDTLGPVAFFQAGDRPALGAEGGVGWMSGACIHAKALYAVRALKERVGLPVVGVGGVMDAAGVRRMYAAGADAVGLCSAVLIHGLGLLEEIKRELRESPAPGALPAGDYAGRVHIQVDRALCSNCGRCADSCGYLALRMEDGVLRTDDAACRRCGLCQQHCPAIRLTQRPGIDIES